MNIAGNPPLLDHLASSYALGALRGGARRRFEALSRQSATVRVAALIWQERLGAMTELQPSAEPDPNVWKRIENLLSALPGTSLERLPAGMLDGLRRALVVWRGAALVGGAGMAAAMLLGIHLNRTVDTQAGLLSQAATLNAQLLTQLKATPDIQYVAVLADDKANPSMLVTFDPRNQRLILKRVGGFQEASDKSLQLWALPPEPTAGQSQRGPQSLGVLGDGKVIRLTAAEGQVRAVPALAISLEPKGGVPGDKGPTGPVLFKGALLQTPS